MCSNRITIRSWFDLHDALSLTTGVVAVRAWYMTRLSGYLLRLFSTGALVFFAVAGFLIYVVQTLGLFDLVTAKGQDVFTLFGQSALITPSLALQIIYICMAVGMTRALRGLQLSRELHTVHSSGRLKALWQAAGVFVLGGMVIISGIAHWLEPTANRLYANWSAEITADLVGRSLNPNRFSEVVPGLIMVIGGRARDGSVIDFFADDSRNPRFKRTYVAKRAVIVSGPEGYNLALSDGAIQYLRPGGQFTEINFSRYELGLDPFGDDANDVEQLGQHSSLKIIADAGGLGALNHDRLNVLSKRFAEATRLAALCLLVFCLTAFPTGQRQASRVPLEIIIVVIALADRGIGSVLMSGSLISHHLGAIILLISACFALSIQLYGNHLPRLRRRPA